MRAHIEELRKAMAAHNVVFFTTLTSDAHGSEYISEHDNTLKYISGFTGTNGRLAVTKDKALLWTDGRYFIQAEEELRGSGIELMKLGEPGVPAYSEWLEENGLPDILTDEKIVNEIWADRPARPAEPIWKHELKWAGMSACDKLNRVYLKMRASDLSEIYVNALDDIAWLFNLRGSDIPYNPVFYSFLHISDTVTIYLQEKSLSDEIREYLTELNVEIRDYNTFEHREEYSNIISEIKTHKTPDELNHMRESGLRDGVYMTKFIYWLKKQTAMGTEIDEIDASDHLDALRASDPYYVSLSFPTISAYASNAAIVHYHSTEESRRRLMPRGLYLVDSGGQYLDGTTDVTRTIVLGPLTAEEKQHYTLACIGMLRVLNSKFTIPCKSTIIDECARSPLRSHDLEFNHGTGHGVGYLGCVHESPASISRSNPAAQAKKKPYVFTGHEVISDEPGVYIEGSHGVRIENMVAVTGEGFETLTWVPLEKEALDYSVMTEEDIEMFERYQQEVKEKISPFLNPEEKEWLLNEI